MVKLVSFQNRVRLFPSGYGIVGIPRIGTEVLEGVGVVVAVGSSGVVVGLAVIAGLAVGAEVAVDVGGMGVAEGWINVWVG